MVINHCQVTIKDALEICVYTVKKPDMLTADGFDKATHFYLSFTQEPLFLLLTALWALGNVHL